MRKHLFFWDGRLLGLVKRTFRLISWSDMVKG